MQVESIEPANPIQNENHRVFINPNQGTKLFCADAVSIADAKALREEGYQLIYGHGHPMTYIIALISACDAVLYHGDTKDPVVNLARCIAAAMRKPEVAISWHAGMPLIAEYIPVLEVKAYMHPVNTTASPVKPDFTTLPKILVVGPGRSGKDTLGTWLHDNTEHTYAGSTSLYLAKYVAAEYDKQGYLMDDNGYKKGYSGHEVLFNERHGHRREWFRIGNLIRKNSHGMLQEEALRKGNVVAGIRDFKEAAWACYREIYDHIIWIDADVPVDPTITFTAQDLAVMLEGKRTTLTVIKNDGSPKFCEVIAEFAKSIRTLRKEWTAQAIDVTI